MAVNLIVSATVQKKEDFTINNPIISLNEFAINSEGYEDTVTTGVKLGDGQTRWNDLPYLQNLTHDMVNTWLQFETETTNSRLITLPDMRIIYANAVAVSDAELDTAIRQTDTISTLLTMSEQQKGEIKTVQSNLDRYKELHEPVVSYFSEQIKKHQELLDENVPKIASKVEQATYDEQVTSLMEKDENLQKRLSAAEGRVSSWTQDILDLKNSNNDQQIIIEEHTSSINTLQENKYDQSAGEALDERLTTAEEKIKNIPSGGSVDLSQTILTGGNSTTN